MDERFEKIVKDALKEIKRQDDKWGKDRKKHPLEWQCILNVFYLRKWVK